MQENLLKTLYQKLFGSVDEDSYQKEDLSVSDRQDEMNDLPNEYGEVEPVLATVARKQTLKIKEKFNHFFKRQPKASSLASSTKEDHEMARSASINPHNTSYQAKNRLKELAENGRSRGVSQVINRDEHKEATIEKIRATPKPARNVMNSTSAQPLPTIELNEISNNLKRSIKRSTRMAAMDHHTVSSDRLQANYTGRSSRSQNNKNNRDAFAYSEQQTLLNNLPTTPPRARNRANIDKTEIFDPFAPALSSRRARVEPTLTKPPVNTAPDKTPDYAITPPKRIHRPVTMSSAFDSYPKAEKVEKNPVQTAVSYGQTAPNIKPANNQIIEGWAHDAAHRAKLSMTQPVRPTTTQGIQTVSKTAAQGSLPITPVVEPKPEEPQAQASQETAPLVEQSHDVTPPQTSFVWEVIDTPNPTKTEAIESKSPESEPKPSHPEDKIESEADLQATPEETPNQPQQPEAIEWVTSTPAENSIQQESHSEQITEPSTTPPPVIIWDWSEFQARGQLALQPKPAVEAKSSTQTITLTDGSITKLELPKLEQLVIQEVQAVVVKSAQTQTSHAFTPAPSQMAQPVAKPSETKPEAELKNNQESIDANSNKPQQDAQEDKKPIEMVEAEVLPSSASIQPTAHQIIADVETEKPTQDINAEQSLPPEVEVIPYERPAPYSDDSLPDIDLLAPAEPPVEGCSEEFLLERGIIIEEKCAEFKVNVRVVDACAGPVITRYEVEPATGVRGSQVVNLMKDLSRALGLASIRVVETIPGKTCMGLELPNPKRQMIRLSEILSADVFQHSRSKLTLCLGKDITGKPVVTNLAKAPHMLVAGTTGSGKSVGVNAMILSMLYKATPDQVRFIMIDPKMLELSVYNDIPHLLAPVVTDMKKAANALNWCVNEMEKRYQLMSAMGVRNLAGFNEKVKDAEKAGHRLTNPFTLTPDNPEPLETLPAIVVVVDEFADLMMVAGKKIEELIARIAQKARAAGIHLILATQRPSVDVITGLIKANIPTRVAFQVSSKVDSRTILDQPGAESLLGMGDMLFLPPGTCYPQRIHGAFVSDEEVHAVVEHLKQIGEPNYVDGILDGETSSEEDMPAKNTGSEEDPLYDEAVNIVIRDRKASISYIQRQLRIGYNRAARLIEEMERAQLVSPAEPNGNRTVLVPQGGGI